MNNVITMSLNAPQPATMHPIQRALFFLTGFSIIVTTIIATPATTMWMAFANIVGIGLVTAAIIGRDWRMSNLIMPGRKRGAHMQPLTNATLAITISVATMAAPAVPLAWFALAQSIATLFMLSALLMMEFVMTDKKHADIESVDVITEPDMYEWSMPKAA